MIALRILLLMLTLVCVTSAHGQKKVYFTSLEWPPYSGENLKGQGASVAVARAAFDAMGYELHVDFYPWARTVGLAKRNDSRYHGYFPEYYSADIAETFLFSEPMGKGPLGLIEHMAKPVAWQSIDDLSNFKIGVVRGYVNTDELDKRIADGRIKVEPVVADLDNLKKLTVGRLELAVMDPNVFRYLMANEPALAKHQRALQVNPKLLEEKDLYLCFKNTDEGRELLAIFNEGLKQIDVKGIMADYLRQ